MLKEQVIKSLEMIGGVECVGFIQLRNEPFYFVTGTPDETHDELRYNGVTFDHENELVSITKENKIVRVQPYSQINAIVSKDETLGKNPKYDMWGYAQKLHNQTPNRQFEK